jgi:5-methylcytosine-specific restriction endonuclease McrA
MKLRTIGEKLGPPRRSKLRPREKKAAPFYLSPEWRVLMQEIIAERGRRCADPAHDPGKSRVCGRVFGDHIVELADGGAPLSKDNVMLRCGACHTRKTAAARARRWHPAPGVGGV